MAINAKNQQVCISVYSMYSHQNSVALGASKVVYRKGEPVNS